MSLRCFRQLAVVALLLCSSFLAGQHTAQADDCNSVHGRTCDGPRVGNGKYVYAYDAERGLLSRSRPSFGGRVTDGTGKNARVWEESYSPACREAMPPGEDGTTPDTGNCQNAVANPNCDPGEFAMWGYRRLVGPPQQVARELDPDALDDTDWQLIRPEPYCFGPDQEWDLGDLAEIARADISEYLEAHAIRSDIRLEPEGGTLVNVPVLAHTDQAPPIGFDVTEPFPGRLDATAGYSWDFGEGPAQEGLGHPYTPTVSAFAHDGYYIAHAYTGAGPRTITLTTTWTATFTVAGFTIPLPPIEFSNSADLTVREARSALIAGDN